MASAHRKKALIKIIVIGDSNVGKTSLLSTYVHKRFTAMHKATIGADFLSKEISIDDRMVTLQIWDTAGQDRFQSLGKAFYRGSEACLLVFDITNKKSFENIEGWKQEFTEHLEPTAPNPFPFILIGNKSDLASKRQVTTKEAELWCANHGNIPYFETSAKDSINVEQAFSAVAKTALKNQRDGPVLPDPQRFKLNEPAPAAQPSGSCCN